MGQQFLPARAPRNSGRVQDDPVTFAVSEDAAIAEVLQQRQVVDSGVGLDQVDDARDYASVFRRQGEHPVAQQVPAQRQDATLARRGGGVADGRLVPPQFGGQKRGRVLVRQRFQAGDGGQEPMAGVARLLMRSAVLQAANMLRGFPQRVGPVARRRDQRVQVMQGGVVLEEIG